MKTAWGDDALAID